MANVPGKVNEKFNPKSDKERSIGKVQKQTLKRIAKGNRAGKAASFRRPK